MRLEIKNEIFQDMVGQITVNFSQAHDNTITKNLEW
jgi:hypothetical protein